MDIEFNCDFCGHGIVIDEAGAGAVIECPKCSESVVVPELKRPIQAAASNLRRCPDCGREISKRAAACPHCGAPLNAPNRPAQQRAAYIQATPAEAPTVDEGTLGAAYLLAIFLPFIGFFFGIYLLAKKQPGHGVACLAISVAAFCFWFWIFLGSSS